MQIIIDKNADIRRLSVINLAFDEYQLHETSVRSCIQSSNEESNQIIFEHCQSESRG